MKTKVSETIESFGMLDGVGNVCVALSGGADSMSLLHYLHEHEDTYGIRVSAVHINHGIRGDEAKRDEEFVRAWCEKNGIPLDIYRLDIPSVAKEKHISEELAGRNERYRIFGKYTDPGVVATAHNLNDCEETFLFNLSRGTGLKGLKGIPPVRGSFIRPLIFCSKQEILAYCEENSVPFVTDSTNLTDEYSRNYIRLNIIPALVRLNPSFHSNFARAQKTLERDNSCLEELTKQLTEKAKREKGYSLEGLGSLHPALQYRFVSAVFSALSCGDHEERHIEFVIKHAGENFSLTLPGGDIIDCRDGILDKRETSATETPQTAGLTVPGCFVYGKYRITLLSAEGNHRDRPANDGGNHYQYFADLDAVNGSLSAGPAFPGETLRAAGRNVTKQIRRILSELRVPADERQLIPVIRDESGAIALPGCGPCERCRITASTKNVLKIIFEENNYD